MKPLKMLKKFLLMLPKYLLKDLLTRKVKPINTVKKKSHTLKWLIVCDKNKQILFISNAYDGKVHDITIFKETLANFDFSKLKIYVDLGFLGIKKIIKFNELFIPIKASKKHQLSDLEKEYNCTISRIRIIVENAIAKLKSFFILRIENRIRIKDKLNDASQICANLVNFKLNSLIIKP